MARYALYILVHKTDKLYENEHPRIMGNTKLDETVGIKRIIQNSTEMGSIEIRNAISIDI